MRSANIAGKRWGWRGVSRFLSRFGQFGGCDTRLGADLPRALGPAAREP
jgi:hypothetical protein